LGNDEFRVTTGTAFGAQDMGWIVLHAPRDHSVEIKDVTMDYACLGLWGPHARKVLEQVTQNDVSNENFPYMTAQRIEINGTPTLAQRVSYVGELGWELYMANADAMSVWDTLMEAGKPFGIRPAGYKALETLRLEKSYRYWSADITPADNPYESGQGFCVKLNKGDGSSAKPSLCNFIGREALLKIRAQGLQKKLCPITIDPNCVINGGEAVYADGKVVGRVRSGGYGYTLGVNIGHTYLPLELTTIGTPLMVDVLGEHVPAQVAPDPLFDPKGERLRA
jgi:4-methylaminobutanoate oxidase (formaldehyde-forming)